MDTVGDKQSINVESKNDNESLTPRARNPFKIELNGLSVPNLGFRLPLDRSQKIRLSLIVVLILALPFGIAGVKVARYLYSNAYNRSLQENKSDMSSVTPTSSPATCNEYCLSDEDCSDEEVCYFNKDTGRTEGVCRSPDCLGEIDCTCKPNL